MGLLSRKLGLRALNNLEDPAQPLLPNSALFESQGLGRSDAGMMVNVTQAMRITTAQSCIRIISEDLSSTSHEILQDMPDGSIRRATEHRLWPILHDQPNPHMSSMVFWGALLASALGWGNGYAWIKRDGAARVTGLVLLASARTSAVKAQGRLMYATTQTETGGVAYIDPQNILHIRGLSFDGNVGISPIESCKNAFGLASAAEKFGAQFFGRGARASGVLSHPGQLEPEAFENLKKSVGTMATGDTALGPIILEEGMKWEQITVNPTDAQFLGVRQFQRSEIAALYRVAMHLLQDLSRATNNNIEHQSLDHTRYCLRPWAIRIEQEVYCKLLGGSYRMEHNFNDLQRGDFASQSAGFQILRNIGVYSANDVLKALRQNPIPAEAGGDIRMVQGAMIPLTSLLPAGDDGEQSPSTNSDGGAAQPFNRIVPAFRVLVRDAVGRVTNRSERDSEFVRKAFRPATVAMAQALLAMRFGNSTLTDRDMRGIDAVLGGIVASAPVWERKDASAIADRLTETLYRGFAGEDVQ